MVIITINIILVIISCNGLVPVIFIPVQQFHPCPLDQMAWIALGPRAKNSHCLLILLNRGAIIVAANIN